jgi:hypothetical protein
MRGRSLPTVAMTPSCSLLLAAACESAPKPGVIDGMAMPCAGPDGFVGPRPVLAMTVKNLAGKQLTHRTVRSPYRFRFTIKSGDYIVTASVSADTPKKVHVQPGKTSSVTLMNACL